MGVSVGMAEPARKRFMVVSGVRAWLRHATMVANGFVSLWQARLLAPIGYLAMVFAAIVGFVFWGEVPVATTWIGGAIIAASGLFIFLRRQQRNPSAKPVVNE
jgi:drug/metabolite transporter (DMT)-like permease